METALAVYKPAPAELTLAQAAWDLFLYDALLDFDDPNPDLCRDLALDKTIRALGQQPQAPLTPEEREALAIQVEVECLLTEQNRHRNIGPFSARLACYQFTEDKE